jgi:hypothetical protein
MTSHQQAMGALLDEHSSLTGLRVKTLSAYDFPGWISLSSQKGDSRNEGYSARKIPSIRFPYELDDE